MAQLASTPVGMEVRAVVRLGGVNDRRLTFMFEAFDAVEKDLRRNPRALHYGYRMVQTANRQKLRKVG